MTYNFFIWGMRILTLVSAGLMLTALIFLPPYTSPNLFQEVLLFNVVIFEISLFFFLFGIFSLLLFRVRKIKLENPRKKELDLLVGVSTRQGFLLALVFLILLIMQSFRILFWWDGLLVVGAIILVELYFLIK